jgi:hypothetical protein
MGWQLRIHYSLDLRERVVAAVTSGLSRRAAAERFKVSVSTAIRWTRRTTETAAQLPCQWAASGRLGWPLKWIGCWPVAGEAGHYPECLVGRVARARGEGELLRGLALCDPSGA